MTGLHAEARPAQPKDEAAQPLLSVLIPFLRDDPLPLVRLLAAEAAPARAIVEVLLYDDGSQDAGLTSRIRADIDSMQIEIRLISSKHNRGRAAARNALAGHARGAWLLFLDAGLQVEEGFLTRHLDVARSQSFDAGFGGLSYQASRQPELALHAAIVTTSEVKPAIERARLGATAFCSGNLLMRREVAQAIPFEEDYAGWGWEDVDWALRADRMFRLAHFDNPVSRLPSDPPDVLLKKYRAAAPNLARLVGRFPEITETRGVRLAAAMGRVPGQRHLRAVWSGAAQSPILPLKLRVLALKLWRASFAAEAIGK